MAAARARCYTHTLYMYISPAARRRFLARSLIHSRTVGSASSPGRSRLFIPFALSLSRTRSGFHSSRSEARASATSHTLGAALGGCMMFLGEPFLFHVDTLSGRRTTATTQHSAMSDYHTRTRTYTCIENARAEHRATEYRRRRRERSAAARYAMHGWMMRSTYRRRAHATRKARGSLALGSRNSPRVLNFDCSGFGEGMRSFRVS